MTLFHFLLDFVIIITLLWLDIAVAAAKWYAPQIFKDEHNPSIKPIKKCRNFSLQSYETKLVSDIMLHSHLNQVYLEQLYRTLGIHP